MADQARSLGARLALVERQEGLSPKEVAARLGIPLRTYQDYKSDSTAPKVSVLLALHDLGVSADWLISGHGAMRLGEADSASNGKPPALAESLPKPYDPGDYVFLPRYDVKAAAGPGQLVHSEQIVDYLAFRADWVRDKLRLNPKDLLLLEASGDSMEPTIAHGDLLLLDTSADRFRGPAVYVLSIESMLIVKRVEVRVGAVVIKSDNPRYDPETVTLDQAVNLRVVGQVVWHGGLV